MAGNLRFNVDADNNASGEFVEIAGQLAEVGRQLRSLDGKTARTKVQVALDGATAALTAIAKVDASLKALPNSTKTTVNVDVDKDTPSRLASIGSSISRLTSLSGPAADGLTKLRNAAKVVVDPESSSIVERYADIIANKFHKAVDAVRPVVDKLKTGLEGLDKGFLAIGGAGIAVKAVGALGTSLAQLSGVAALAPAVLLGVGGAFATAKLATVGFGDALTGSAKKQAAAYAAMGPAARQLVDSLKSLGPAANSLRQAVQDSAVAGLGTQIKTLAGTYMPMLKTQLSFVAQGYNTMASAAIKALQSSAAVGQVKTILSAVGVAVGQMGGSLANAALGFIRLGAAGAGWLPKIAAGIDSAAEKFNAWSILVTTDGSFDRWVNTGVAALKQLGTILGNLASIGGTVFSALNANGAGLFATLAALTGQLRTFLQSAQGASALQALAQTLNIAGVALQQVFGAALKAIGPILVSLAPLIQAYATYAGNAFVTIIQIAAPLLQAFARILGEHPALLVAIAQAASVVTLGFGPMVAIIGVAGTVLKGMLIARLVGAAMAEMGVAGTVLSRVALALVSPMAALREIGPLVARGFGALTAQLGIMAGPIGLVVVAFATLYATSSQFRDAVNGVAAVVGGLFMQAMQQAGVILSSTVHAFTDMFDASNKGGSALGDFAHMVAGVFGPAGKIIQDVLTVTFGLFGKIAVAAGVAFAAFKTFGLIAPIFTTASAAVAGFSARLLAFQSSSAVASAAATGIGKAAAGVSTALTKVGSALPIIGVALIGVGLIYDQVSSKADEFASKVLNGSLTVTQAVNAQEDSYKGFLGFFTSSGWSLIWTDQERHAQAAKDVADAYKLQYDALSPMDKLQADVTTSGKALADAVAQYTANSPQAREAANTLATAQSKLKDAQQGAADAAKTEEDRLKDLANQMASQVNATLAYERAVRATADAQAAATAALTSGGAGSAKYKEATDALTGAMEAQAEAAQKQVEAIAGPTAGTKAYYTEILRTANLASTSGRDAFIKYAASIGDSGRQALSAAAEQTGLRTEILKLPGNKTVKVVVDADRGKLPTVEAELSQFTKQAYVGKVTLDGDATKFGGVVHQAVTLANGTSALITLDGNSKPVETVIGKTKYTIDSTTGVMKIDGDPAPGDTDLSGFKLRVDSTTGVMTLDGNTAPVDAKTLTAKSKVDTSIGVMTIDGNPTLVNGKTTAAVTFANGSKGTITVDGQPDPATGKINATVHYADGSTGHIQVDANAAAANAAIDNAARNRTTTIFVKYEGVQTSAGNVSAGRLARGGIVGYATGGIVGYPRRAATGMVVPGYAPGRDTEHTILSKGEGVAVPQLVREVGAGRFLAANSAALAGRSGLDVLSGNNGRVGAVMSTQTGNGGQNIGAAYAAGLSAVAGQVGQLRGDVQALAGAIRSARPITVEDRSGNPVETARTAALALRL